MKYIKTYADNASYEADKPNFEFPHVGYIEGSDEVKYINDMAELYDIYGTLTGAGVTATIQINGTNYSVSPSGSDNEFGLVFSQPVTGLSFSSQSRIKTLDKIGVDTSAVTNMQDMFRNCDHLTTLDVSNFNTSASKNMSSMFINCYALTTLDVSNWNTSAVTNMGYMFRQCNSLTTIDVSNFNTSAVTDMQKMFSNCNALTTLDLSNWNTSAVTNMSGMFTSCNALTTVTMNNTNTTTFDMIKAQLVSDRRTSCQIIRDGLTWTYNGSEWVSQ